MGRDGTDVAIAVSNPSEAGFAGFEDCQDFRPSGESGQSEAGFAGFEDCQDFRSSGKSRNPVKSRNPGNPDSDNGPVRFASDTLGVTLWSKQKEVLRAVERERRVAVKSGNGLGKDFTAAVAVLWYVHAHDPAIVLSTAPTFRQVRHVLWRQIHRLYRNAADTLGGRMLDTRWEVAEDRYALGLSASDADQFQGFHCENMFVVVDEAEGVAEPIYEAVEAVMTSAHPTLLLIGNPTTTSGGFHRAFHRERGIYETITMSALESPNVTAGDIVIPGLTTPTWVEERRQLWGEDSEMFRARVMGEFPDRGEDNLIAISDIEAAVYGGPLVLRQAQDERGHAARGDRGYAARGDRGYAARGELVEPQAHHGQVAEAEPVFLGVDVARFGVDRSVIMVRRGDVVVDVRVFHGFANTEVAGAVIAAVRDRSPRQITVDETGLGSGVVDILHEQGQPVYGFNGSANPLKEEVACANLRAEGYWTLARRFRDHRIRIPRDAELIAELASLRYRYNSRGKVLMESKEDMKRRGLPSPDKADALMLAFLDTGAVIEHPRWMRDLFL